MELEDAGPGCGDGCTNNSCLVTLATGQLGASALAVDATSIYWSTNFGNQPSRVMKVSLIGGAPVQLAAFARAHLGARGR